MRSGDRISAGFGWGIEAGIEIRGPKLLHVVAGWAASLVSGLDGSFKLNLWRGRSQVWGRWGRCLQ